MTGSFPDEIVDDSEPEREEWRRQKKKLKPIPQSPTSTTREVIELTDDESEGHQPDVIDISDCTSDSSSRMTLSSAMPIITSQSQSWLKLNGTRKTVITSVSQEAEEAQVAQMASKTPPPSTTITQPDAVLHDLMPPSISPDYSEDTDEKVNLRLFAFTDSRPSVKYPSSRPSPSRKRSSTIIEPTTNIPPKRKAATKHQFSPDFSNAELAKLTKCVSCNAQWTTRKTPAQKIKHIQSCAKKLSFTDETICLLIRREIDGAVGDADKVSDKKGKGKASAPRAQSPVPKTVYEHVVTDAAPRKKGRRAEVGESVRSVTTTRNAILDRARAVLDSVHADYPTEINISSTAHWPFFGQSALAKKQRSDTRHILTGSSSSTNSSEEAGTSPATQAFAPSKFDSVILNPYDPFKPRADFLVPSVGDDAGANPKNGPPLKPPDFFLDATSSRERALSPMLRRNSYTNQIVLDGLTQTFMAQCNIDDIGDSEDSNGQLSEREMDNDNACLHFDPGVDNQQRLLLAPGSYALPKLASLARSPGSVNIVYSPKEDDLKATEINTKRKGKRLIKPEDNYDELWEARMKQVIVRDTDLYLRILRYEPIHFDVFLKLATDEFSCSASGMLKTHLRKYLDKEAISFYGTEPTGRRR